MQGRFDEKQFGEPIDAMYAVEAENTDSHQHDENAVPCENQLLALLHRNECICNKSAKIAETTGEQNEKCRHCYRDVTVASTPIFPSIAADIDRVQQLGTKNPNEQKHARIAPYAHQKWYREQQDVRLPGKSREHCDAS